MTRRIALLALLALGTAQAQGPDADPKVRAHRDVQAGQYVFLTWYNGWTRHDVWGVGPVLASYSAGTVDCDGRLAPLVPIYDSHADEHEPKANETKAYAKAYNLTVLKLLENDGVNCDFVLIEND
jgi:hypothetical protein